MSKNIYMPHPIDTKEVVLPKELEALAENIAKNVHEVWSAGPMARSGMMQRGCIRALCLMKNYRKKKRSTTATHQ